MYTFEGRTAFQRAPVTEGLDQALDVQAWCQAAFSQYRLDLGAEQQPLSRPCIEEWPDTDPVPCQYQPMCRCIPQGDGKLPVQMVDKAFAEVFIEVHQHFGVRCGVEAVATRLQFRPEFQVVEDLAVEHDRDRAGFVVNGLVAGGEVDDAQARVRKSDAGCQVVAETIWPTVSQGVNHPLEIRSALTAARPAERKFRRFHTSCGTSLLLSRPVPVPRQPILAACAGNGLSGAWRGYRHRRLRQWLRQRQWPMPVRVPAGRD